MGDLLHAIFKLFFDALLGTLMAMAIIILLLIAAIFMFIAMLAYVGIDNVLTLQNAAIAVIVIFVVTVLAKTVTK